MCNNFYIYNCAYHTGFYNASIITVSYMHDYLSIKLNSIWQFVCVRIKRGGCGALGYYLQQIKRKDPAGIVPTGSFNSNSYEILLIFTDSCRAFLGFVGFFVLVKHY